MTKPFLFFILLFHLSVVAWTQETFTNPLLPSGADPYSFYKDGYYYYTHTTGNRLVLYKTKNLAELKTAEQKTIFLPPPGTSYSRELWAPEILFINGKWYAYFAADDGNNANHRMYVLENASSDPLSGNWEMKGKIYDPTDKWAIDGTVMNYNNKLYFIWSGWPGDINTEQDIYIAKMSNPWTIEGNRVLLSAPTYPWERVGAPPAINEGPEAIIHNGKAFITYSASGCWTDDYALGLLTLKAGGDPLNPADWIKSATPIFTKKPENRAYGPGHNAFFKSRDGSEDWIIYHANSSSGQGCGDARNPRMQKFTWNADGSPNFGEPASVDLKIKKPSGEY